MAEKYTHSEMMLEVVWVESQPVGQRREAREEFARDLATNPNLVLERCMWLCQGTYGSGPHEEACKSGSVSWVLQMVALLEWKCPFYGSVGAFQELDHEAQEYLSRAIAELIEGAKQRHQAGG